MSTSLSGKSKVCSVAIVTALACSGAGLAAPAAFADDAASASSAVEAQAAPDRLAPLAAPAFDKNKSYTVDVALNAVSGGSSAVAGLIEKQGTIDVDDQGNPYLTIRMRPGKVFGQDAYASDLKVFKKGESDDSQNPDMSKFAEGQHVTMAPDNSILLQIKIPYIEESGSYRSEVFSGYMNREVILALDWSSMKQASSTSDRLKKLKDEAGKLEAGNYYGPTWKALREAVVEADDVLGLEDSSSDLIVPAIQQMERAFKALRTDMENPFKANSTVFLDVYAEGDVDLSRSIKREAVVETDASGVSTVTVTFNNQNYSFLPGKVKDFVVTAATILDKDGAKGKTVSVADNGKDGVVWKFVLPYNSPSGYYQVLISSDLNGKDKAASLRFDWSTIRDHADFRALNATIKAATNEERYKASNYTSSTFEVFSNALKEAQRIAGDPRSSQEAIDGGLSALNDAMRGLRAIQNQGHAQTVNLGLSAFNAPYDGSGVQDIGWAGSRVRFGIDGASWRVLDAQQGIIMSETVLNNTPFSAQPAEDEEAPVAAESWEKSLLRSYLNKEYYEKSFDDADKAAIATSTIKNEAAGSPQADTQDKVYVLSKKEFANASYGFYDDASRASAEGSQSQFTRTPGNLGIQLVTVSGLMDVWGSAMELPGYTDSLGSSPVLCLNEANVLLTTPAGSDIPSGIQAPRTTDENVWKLTLLDSSRAFDAKAVSRNGNRVVVEYTSGATEGSQVSALIERTDGSKTVVSGYGTVAARAAAKGKAAFDLPAGFDTSKDKLYLFSETVGEVSNLASKKVAIDLSNLAPVSDTNWSRLSGDDAFGTMKAITSSSAGWADKSCDTVVLATSGGYWDALSAAALAGAHRCPVLITDGSSLTAETKSEIERLGAKNVYVCGGPAAVSDDVVRAVDSIPGVNAPVRLFGDDAQQTAVKIAQQVRKDSSAKTCVIATSAGFYDALSVSPWAYASIMPVYLTDASGNLSEAALADIKAAGYADAIIVGGTAAITEGTQSALTSSGGVPAGFVQRLAGQDAWKTSAAIAQKQIETVPGAADTVGLADGNGYWDALTGAALIGKAGGVMLLVPHDGPTADGYAFSYDSHVIDSVIASHAGESSQGFVFGGTAAVPQATMDAAKKAAQLGR